jgi:imidazolonepropionase-like amidohydrolase
MEHKFLLMNFSPMRRPVVWLAGTTVIALAATATMRSVEGRQSSAAVTAFTGVTVIPMDRERVVPNQTVVVRDGRIASVGPASSTAVPAGAIRIDGRGKFLMPGLAEMHAHVLGPQAANSDELNRDIMFLYVANGITTIRAMLGAPNQLTLRDQLKRGEVLGPAMYVAAPSLNGQTAPDAATAERLVRAHKAAGYDLLKIHPGLNKPAYDAIVRTGRDVGITWAGHVSALIGVEHIIDTRQSTIDHLDGYIEAAVSDDVRRAMESSPSQVSPSQAWRSATDAKLRDLAKKTKAAGTWNVPTMFLWESFYLPGSPEDWSTRDEMRYAPKQWLTGWMNQKRQRIQLDAQNGIAPADAALLISLRRKMLKMLADEGAPLLMGTDSPQMFNVPGFALHRELKVAAEAGLTPYQVIASGSRNVGRYVAEDLKQDGRFGTVTEGSRADLVLLDANPLQDLSNLTKRAGVMVGGRWVSRSEIDKGLAALAEKYSR